MDLNKEGTPCRVGGYPGGWRKMNLMPNEKLVIDVKGGLGCFWLEGCVNYGQAKQWAHGSVHYQEKFKIVRDSFPQTTLYRRLFGSWVQIGKETI